MKQFIINTLARVGFKKELNLYAMQHNKKSYKDKLQYAFTDSNGKAYYHFPNLREDMPLPLLEVLNSLQEQMMCRIPGRDLDKWIEASEKLMNSNSKTKITDMGHLLGALKDRRDPEIFDYTILMEIAALLYIREDENPCKYNAELHKEKFEMLWNDSKEGALLYDFFQQAGLGGYIPSGSITKESWPKYLEEAAEKIGKFKSILSQTLTYVSASEIKGKNSETA